MRERPLAVGVRRRTSQRAAHSISHTLRDFLPLRHAATLPHLRLLRAVQQEVGRLVPGCAADRQHMEMIPQAPAQLDAHVVPVVGRELTETFSHL